MKKTDLLTGEIIVQRNGDLGVVIATEKEQYIIHQNSGFDLLMDYDDDMTYMYSDEEDDTDIMQVYRAPGTLGFLDYSDEEPIYERDKSWKEPVEKHPVRQPVKENEFSDVTENKTNDKLITVLTQAFYGNRTSTRIGCKGTAIDKFIFGVMSDDIPITSDEIDRTIVHVPNSNGLVIIYNCIQETERRAYIAKGSEEYASKPLATIPELNLEIYSRCIACRMGEDGEFESLCDEDFEIILKYFSE